MSRLISTAVLALFLGTCPIFSTFPKEQPAPVTTYVVNTNTDKFHDPLCKHVDSIKDKNRWEYTGARDDLVRFGYIPCKECNP